MKKFRSVTSQSMDYRQQQEFRDQASLYPERFPSELYNKLMAPEALNDPALMAEVRKVIKEIQDFDNKYKLAENFFKNNSEDFTFKDYLSKMKQYNVANNIAAAYFENAWNVYKTKFSDPKAFFELFIQLINSSGANLPQGIERLKALIDKLPTTMGKVEDEHKFIEFIVALSQNPDNEKLNEQYKNFIMGEYIKDLILNKADKDTIASNFVDSKAMIREIGKDETQWTPVQKSMNEYYLAYNKFVNNTYAKKIENFIALIVIFNDQYESLERDIIENGLNDESMRLIVDILQRVIRLNLRKEFLSPVGTPPVPEAK
jgi:hypothetical protein